jgi:CDP-diglyceride synthetase
MGLVLSRFAISKLAGWEISVNAFIEMAKPLGIDPTFFRVFTGFIISAVVIGYLAIAIYSLVKNKSEKKYKKSAILLNLFGLLTMIGALIAEFSLRVQPKWMLVYIAIGIVLISTLNIIILKKEKTQLQTV